MTNKIDFLPDIDGLYNTEVNLRRSYVNKLKIENGINGNYLTAPPPIPIASRDSSLQNSVSLHPFYEQSDTDSINYISQIPQGKSLCNNNCDVISIVHYALTIGVLLRYISMLALL